MAYLTSCDFNFFLSSIISATQPVPHHRDLHSNCTQRPRPSWSDEGGWDADRLWHLVLVAVVAPGIAAIWFWLWRHMDTVWLCVITMCKAFVDWVMFTDYTFIFILYIWLYILFIVFIYNHIHIILYIVLYSYMSQMLHFRANKI